MAYPVNISSTASIWPNGVIGAISPYPTVVTVTMAQYTPRGMLVKPASAPSMTYMSDPAITTIVDTASIKTVILRRPALSAVKSTSSAPRNRTSLSTRNTRKTRNTRIVRRNRPGGNRIPINVGRTAKRSTTPKKLVAYFLAFRAL